MFHGITIESVCPPSRNAVMKGVIVSDRVEMETVVVGRGGGRELLADLYRPPTPNGCGVLLIFGGAFVQGDRTQLRGYAIALGRAGYTSLACDYRLAGESKWPAQIDDVLTAFTYLHEHAKSLGLSTTKLAVSGNSAGGCLSLLVAGQESLEVAAAIAFYPPVDFQSEMTKATRSPSEMGYLLGDDVSEKRLREMSPINHVRADFPATLLLTGNRDERVDCSESVHMYEAIIGAGGRAELHVFDGLEHAFDMYPDYGRLSSALMIQFLNSHVLNVKHAGLMS
jgi:acetyl esterase/lipase